MFSLFLRRMLTVTLFAAVAAGCGRNFDGLVAQAQDKFVQKRHIEAIDALTLALAVWRDADGTEKKGKALELLGRAHQAAHQPEKAAVAYEEALKHSGDVYDAAYGLGIIRLAASQFHKGAQAVDLALRMKKDDPLALIGLGNAHFGARN